MHKVRKELPLLEQESQLSRPLSLSYWQKKKLQKLSAQELEKRNMAWVPKGSTLNKNNARASIAKSAAKMKKEKSLKYEQTSQRFPNHWSRIYPYSSDMPLMPMPRDSSSGMIGYPPWAYFNRRMQYNSSHRERGLPNHYSFD